MNKQLRVWTPRRIAGWALVGLGVLVLVTHWLAHLGIRPIPLTMGWQDVLIGYPMGGVLLVIAAIILGQGQRKPQRR